MIKCLGILIFLFFVVIILYCVKSIFFCLVKIICLFFININLLVKCFIFLEICDDIKMFLFCVIKFFSIFIIFFFLEIFIFVVVLFKINNFILWESVIVKVIFICIFFEKVLILVCSGNLKYLIKLKNFWLF